MSTFPKSDSSYSNTRRSLRARLELRGMLWCRPSCPVHLVPPRHARMCGRVRLCAVPTVWAPAAPLMRTYETFH